MKRAGPQISSGSRRHGHAGIATGPFQAIAYGRGLRASLLQSGPGSNAQANGIPRRAVPQGKRVTDHESLRRVLLERSVERGDFVLASGRRSSYYIDCRRSTMSAEGMVLIGRMGWDAIQKAGWPPMAVGGLTRGAGPVAYAIAAASLGDQHAVDAFSVRKETKSLGTGRLIEGNFQAGGRVVVVEDVITTGDSAQRAIQTIEQAGGTVIGVLAVVDRQEGGRKTLEDRGHPVVALTTVRELGLTP